MQMGAVWRGASSCQRGGGTDIPAIPEHLVVFAASGDLYGGVLFRNALAVLRKVAADARTGPQEIKAYIIIT